jgi:hypothetical protein
MIFLCKGKLLGVPKKRKGKFVELATFGSLGNHIVTKKKVMFFKFE